MTKNTTRNQKPGWILFTMYLIVLTYLMLSVESLGRFGGRQSTYAYDLELFKEIKRFYIHREQFGMEAVFLNLDGNVIGFIPFDFILSIVSRRGRHWYNMFMLALELSLGTETTQPIFKVGSFNVDDLLLNIIGGILGYIIYRLVQGFRIRKKRRARGSRVDKV